MRKRTGRMINAGGIQIFIPNDTTYNSKEFYISYNSYDIATYGDVTTALVSNDPVKFLILNGDHTEAYNKIINNGGGYDECVEYFKLNVVLKSKYSEDYDKLLIYDESGKLVKVDDERYTKKEGNQ